MTKIKICGLSRLEDIQAVNEYLPDYVGFVFASSKRQVSVAKAQDLKNHLSEKIAAVGVFVNEELCRIKEIYDRGIIDLVQLHGDESAEYMDNLKKLIDAPLIKAIRIEGRQSLAAVEDCAADFILVDSSYGSAYGGSGHTFDWSLLPSPLGKRFFLAGGINLDNVNQAVALSAYCLDVSSGVETNGFKDPAKISNIIEQVRGLA